jgi:acyl dehydratase
MTPPRIFFEDFAPGDVARYGAFTLTREDLLDFAREFDPQPMHLDEDAAKDSLLGGLAASGWQVCAILMRLVAEGFLLEAACDGAPGIDEVKWLRPVRAGDTLSARHTVLDTRLSRSQPGRGFVRFRFELLNQSGEVVMEQMNSIMFRTRTSGAAA